MIIKYEKFIYRKVTIIYRNIMQQSNRYTKRRYVWCDNFCGCPGHVSQLNKIPLKFSFYSIKINITKIRFETNTLVTFYFTVYEILII